MTRAILALMLLVATTAQALTVTPHAGMTGEWDFVQAAKVADRCNVFPPKAPKVHIELQLEAAYSEGYWDTHPYLWKNAAVRIPYVSQANPAKEMEISIPTDQHVRLRSGALSYFAQLFLTDGRCTAMYNGKLAIEVE